MELVETVIENSNGLRVKTIALGATVTSIQLPNGRQVALGFKELDVYRTNPPYFGCSVGRCANRIANARFTIDGTVYNVTPNAAPNHLHGGTDGFNTRMWDLVDKTNTSVKYKLVSNDGDQGYQGTVTASVTYMINDQNKVFVEYSAITDKPTIVNLTNHTYFNLAGDGQPIFNHKLTLNADKYTPVGDGSIPTGEIATVNGTVFDFTTPHTIGERDLAVPGGRGYDHNYCKNIKDDVSISMAAKLEDPSTNSSLTVYTDQPCVQLYMGGYLDMLDNTTVGLDGRPIQQYSGVCLETQKHPDAINQPSFSSTILKPGEEYFNKTIWEFSW